MLGGVQHRRDLAGKQFGRLRVVEFLGTTEAARPYYRCVCACGRESRVSSDNLISGQVRSCGCLQRDATRARRLAASRGWTSDPLRRMWRSLRCRDGKRVRLVTAAWFESFECFRTGVGGHPGHGWRLYRKNPLKPLGPGNFVWKTRAVGVCARIREALPLEVLVPPPLSIGAPLEHHPKRGETTRARWRDRTFRIYYNMIRRCENPRHISYPNYGGRGAEHGGPVRVCVRWRESYESFLTDMGPCPSDRHSIDRIDRGDYTPANCRWVPSKFQSRNRRNVRLATWAGQTRPVREWARLIGISYGALTWRLRVWPIERAMTLPRVSRYASRWEGGAAGPGRGSGDIEATRPPDLSGGQTASTRHG